MNSGTYILLGTNQGNREANLFTARQHISSRVGTIITASSVYKTAAWGNTNQPEFYNQVIEIRSTLTPETALTAMLDIEKEMGRVRIEKWGPRIIDIDLLLWQNQIIKTEFLKLPHPGIPDRRFTLIPLAEIAADLIHPESKKTITRMLLECTDTLAAEKVINSGSFSKD